MKKLNGVMVAGHLLVAIFLTVLMLDSLHLKSQTLGVFYVENNTDCAYNVELWHAGGGCTGGGNCPGTKIPAQNQAAANSVTQVHNGTGGGLGNAWIQVAIKPSSTALIDGLCGSTPSTGPECNGADVTITWIDCNNARID